MSSRRLVSPAHVSRSDDYAFGAATLGSDGNIYASPMSGGYILAFNPETLEFNLIDVPVPYDTSNGVFDFWTRAHFPGIASTPTGKIYLSPLVFIPPPAYKANGIRDWSVCKLVTWDGWDALRWENESDGRQALLVVSWDTISKTLSFRVQKCPHTCDEFWCIATASNGKLFCPPATGSVVAVIDPKEDVVSFIGGAGRGSQRNKWTDIFSAADGFLYCAPGRARSVLVIDPAKSTLYHLEDEDVFDDAGCIRYVDANGAHFYDATATCRHGRKDVQAWGGTAQAENGWLYCSPLDATAVLVIDPDTWTLSTIELRIAYATARNKWSGIVSAADGKLYCAPWCAWHVLIIDPIYKSLAFISIPAWTPGSGLGEFKWSGIVATDSRIWCVPDRASTLLTLLVPDRSDYSKLRKLPVFFDATISTDAEVSIPCHKAVLMASSNVFKTMLTSGYREARDADIRIKAVSAATVEAFVDYIYTRNLQMGVDLSEVATLANMYGLHHLLALCLEGVSEVVDETNVADVARTLRLYSACSPEAAFIWRTFLHTVVNNNELFCSANL